MPTTFVNTIDGNELLAKRSQCDYAGNVIQTTYATKSELPTATSDLTNDSGFITSSDIPVTDVTVNGTSVVSNGTAAVTVPTATSDLQNDSGFITSSDIPVTDVEVDGVSVVSGGVASITMPNVPVTDVTVNGTSVVSNGTAAVTVPTATSDLTNDSGFITSSDIPAQVNADWDSNSGASEILNKPDLSIYAETANLATVATTGDYDDLVNKPTIPQAQVNSDWNSSSGVSQILNKPSLAAVATTGDYDDLVNKPSIPAAQVNADWNSSSGVSEILNKPTLAAVATSGDYSDLSNTPTIPTATSDLQNDSGFITASDVPSAQAQADWTESDTTDPSYIAHKPTLAAVATSGDYSDLSGTPTINNVPAVSSSDDAKVLKASYTGGVGSYSWETETDTTYSAGTGIDITSNTISVENPLPSSTSSDEGKVLKVDANGDPTWATGGGGGGVNADWAESDPLEPSYIENKPVPKTLTAGANISISEGVGTLTISAAAGLPASTSADEGKCLVVDSNGDPEWGTGGKTYTGTDGVVVDNVNDTVGLEAPVDLVGGPGITVDNPDGNTVRISVNQPARETILYYSNTDSPGDSQRTYTLSETPMNFERIGIFMFRPVTGNWMGYTEFDTAYMQAVNKNSLTVPIAFIQNTDHFLGLYGVSGILTSSWADVQGGQMVIGSAYSKGYFAHIYKIIGINRIANN